MSAPSRRAGQWRVVLAAAPYHPSDAVATDDDGLRSDGTDDDGDGLNDGRQTTTTTTEDTSTSKPLHIC